MNIKPVIFLLNKAIDLIAAWDTTQQPPTAPNIGPGRKIAIDIGHSPSEEGATHALAKIGEFAWNAPLADQLATDLSKLGHTVRIFNRHPHNSISRGVDEINEWDPYLIISLHFNAYDKTKSGTEVLYCRGSKKSQSLAGYVQDELTELLDLPDRGIKGKVKGEDGFAFLQQTYAPAIIPETFFGDNPHDCQRVEDRGGRPAISRAIVRGVQSWLMDN